MGLKVKLVEIDNSFLKEFKFDPKIKKNVYTIITEDDEEFNNITEFSFAGVLKNANCKDDLHGITVTNNFMIIDPAIAILNDKSNKDFIENNISGIFIYANDITYFDDNTKYTGLDIYLIYITNDDKKHYNIISINKYIGELL